MRKAHSVTEDLSSGPGISLFVVPKSPNHAIKAKQGHGHGYYLPTSSFNSVPFRSGNLSSDALRHGNQHPKVTVRHKSQFAKHIPTHQNGIPSLQSPVLRELLCKRQCGGIAFLRVKGTNSDARYIPPGSHTLKLELQLPIRGGRRNFRP